MAPRERFAGKVAVVTGAGGFLGGATVLALVREGAEVRGLDRDERAAAAVAGAGAGFVRADVTDPVALADACAGADLLVHTAAYVREWGAMEEFVHVNTRGTALVLDAAQAAGVERVVHLSSVVVYGYDSPAEQSEEAPLRTVGNPYIDTKSASDRIARRRGAVVIRPGDVYGPGSVPWVVRPVTMLRHRLLALPARGAGIFLAVYVDDLVEAIMRGLEAGKPGRAYTVWEGVPATIGEYFDRLAQECGAPRPPRLPRALIELSGTAMERLAPVIGAEPRFGAGAATLTARAGTVSIERIRSELGWEPRISLDDGLRRTGEWLRAEGLA